MVRGGAGLVQRGLVGLCDCGAHFARGQMGAHGAFTGVTMRTWVTPDGVAEPGQVEALLSPDAGPYLTSTACVALENTHNFGGGTVQPRETLAAVSALCRDAGVRLHLDGARLWNAHVATGVPLAEYGRMFDTVNVCFSKGLGAPVGSVLVGDADAVARARVLRKRLGGGWRQAGMLAAACLHALDHHIDRLADDHAAASAFAGALTAALATAGGGHGAVVSEPRTNIVVVHTGDAPAAAAVARAAERGVALSALGARVVRAVTHLDVTPKAAEDAGTILGEALVAR